MKKVVVFLMVIIIFGASFTVKAAGWGDSINNLKQYVSGAGLESDLSAPVGSLIQTVLVLVGMIFLTLTVYAGFLWMTAAGNEEKVGKAQKIITAAVIGMVVVGSAYAITYFVTKSLGASFDGASGGGSNASCAQKGGRCLGDGEKCVDKDGNGGAVTSDGSGCRCCLPAGSSDVPLPDVTECWYEGDSC